MKSYLKQASQSYVEKALRDYGKYVVEDRAVADIRDGLKPVQRRILWALHRMGLHPTAKTQKSAQVTGEVMGKFHPHSDCYQSVVNMVNSRYPLVDGQGSFGNNYTDSAAASRYTEVRLHKNAESLIGRDDDVLTLVPTYDGEYKEPTHLPAELPFLLLNGSAGIAVGIASEIPPHNLNEVIAALQAQIEGKPKDIVQSHILGPDYGYGVVISPPEHIRALYETGEGSISYRCAYKFEKLPNGDQALVITSWAPRINIEKLLTQTLAQHVENGNLISVADECSADNGVRITIAFDNPRFIHDHVLKLLETSVTYRFYVNVPHAGDVVTKKLSFDDIMTFWVDHLRQTETAYIQAGIDRAQKHKHVLEVKNLCVTHIKRIVDIVTSSQKDAAEQIAALCGFSLEDADYVLDKIPLRSLGKLSATKVQADIKQVDAQLKQLHADINNVDAIIIKNLEARKESVGRLMHVSQKRPKLVVPEDAPNTWVFGTKEGEILRIDGSPESRRGKFRHDFIVEVGHSFWVVLTSGLMQRVETASLALNKAKVFPPIAGIVSSSSQRIVVLDAEGSGVVLDSSTLKRDKYQGIKTNSSVVSAIGMAEDDALLVFNEKVAYIHSRPETTRVNSSGWRFIPKYKNGATSLLAVRDGKLFALQKGKMVKLSAPTDQAFASNWDAIFSSRIFVVDDNGKHIFDDLTKVVVSKDSTLINVAT